MEEQQSLEAVSPRLIEIRDEDAISINAALDLAHQLNYPVGKSTLQRWANIWKGDPHAAVPCILVETPEGRNYKLDRNEFEAWVQDRLRNRPSRETSSNLTRPHEASPDSSRSRETSPETGEARADSSTVPSVVPAPTQANHQPSVSEPSDSRYIARLEGEIDFLRAELTTKNAQIKEMTDRSRETNMLIAGLQRMLSPLLGGAKEKDNSEPPFRDASQADETLKRRES